MGAVNSQSSRSASYYLQGYLPTTHIHRLAFSFNLYSPQIDGKEGRDKFQPRLAPDEHPQCYDRGAEKTTRETFEPSENSLTASWEQSE